MTDTNQKDLLAPGTLHTLEDVPPMPDGLHDRWMAAVKETPMMKHPEPRRRIHWLRIASTAAALVFLVSGTAIFLNRQPAVTPRATTESSYSYEDTYSDYTAGDAMLYASTTSTSAPMERASLGSGSAPTNDSTMLPEGRKIIRSAALTITTPTFEDSLNHIRQTCTEQGGWIADFSQSGNTSRTAYLTLRIPSTALDAFLSGTDQWGRITKRSETTTDMTEQYTDTAGRLASQQALMARMVELAASATDMEDLLFIEEKMAEIQYNIDSLTGSLTRIDRQVDYATVSLTLREDTPKSTAEDTTVTLGQRIASAFTLALEGTAEFAASALVFIVSMLPLGALLLVVVLVVRGILRARKRRKAAKQTKSNP